jgi:hypothetical protein
LFWGGIAHLPLLYQPPLERIENERSGGENQKDCRANKAHLLLLREDGREIGWRKEVWKRRETIEKERAGE